MKNILFLGFLFLLGTSAIFTQTKKEVAEENKKTVIYSVKGMTCANCVANVENKLDKVDGVIKYDINLKQGTAIIDYDSKKVDEKSIKSALEATGFKISAYSEKEDEKTKSVSSSFSCCQ